MQLQRAQLAVAFCRLRLSQTQAELGNVEVTDVTPPPPPFLKRRRAPPDTNRAPSERRAGRQSSPCKRAAGRGAACCGCGRGAPRWGAHRRRHRACAAPLQPHGRAKAWATVPRQRRAQRRKRAAAEPSHRAGCGALLQWGVWRTRRSLAASVFRSNSRTQRCTGWGGQPPWATCSGTGRRSARPSGAPSASLLGTGHRGR